jgi:hypothetical protein
LERGFGFRLVNMPAICFCSNAACISGTPPSGRSVTDFSKPSLRSTRTATRCVDELNRVIPIDWPFSPSAFVISGCT